MEDIIKRLSEIENTAKSIVANAREQKDILKQEMLKRQAALDNDLNQKTSEQLEQLRVCLEKSKDDALAKLNEDTLNIMSSLEAEYNENHELYARNIVKSLTEV